MGKVDAFSLITIRWITNICSQASEFERPRLRHAVPCIAKTMFERTEYILDTLLTEYIQQPFTESSRYFTIRAHTIGQFCVLITYQKENMTLELQSIRAH